MEPLKGTAPQWREQHVSTIGQWPRVAELGFSTDMGQYSAEETQFPILGLDKIYLGRMTLEIEFRVRLVAWHHADWE